MTIRKIAPAGVPYKITELLPALWGAFASADIRSVVGKALCQHAGIKHCFVVNSGRAAFTIILKALMKTAPPDRDEVVIPAYTCFSVPSSIVRAGLKIRLADLDPGKIDYDYRKLGEVDFRKVLAIIPCNLFGIVSDWKELTAIARQNNLEIIDDSAQTFGIIHDGRQSGSWGKAGFYSFGRGKNITAVGGGAIMTDSDELAAAIAESMNRAKPPRPTDDIKAFLKIVVYSIFLRPYFFGIPESLPFLGLGKTVYDENFPIAGLSRLQTAVLLDMLKKIEWLNTVRAENARFLAESIAKDETTGGFVIPGRRTDYIPPYLRLPVLAPSNSLRRKAIADLNRAGIGASTMYPSTIKDIPGLESHLVGTENKYPGAAILADRLFTLPTHPYVARKDLEIISRILGRLSERSE